MPNIIGKLLLFLGSYAPLFFICGVVFLYSKQDIYAIFSFVLFVVGVIGTWIFTTFIKKIGSRPFEIISITREDTQILSYIATYLIPFVVLIQPLQPEGDHRQLLAFGLFFILGFAHKVVFEHLVLKLEHKVDYSRLSML